MKQLEITTNKRLLVVEYVEMKFLHIDFRNSKTEKVISLNGNDVKIKAICKGSDLTEQILRTLIKNEISEFLVSWNWDYVSKEPLNDDFFPPMQSFISAIEANNYHWGENPLGKKPELTDSRYNEEQEFIENNPDELVMGDYYADWSIWQEAEYRTFNPSKCIIFEIV